MEDFTGGVVESYDLSKDVGFNLFKYMKSSNARLSLQSCSIKVGAVVWYISHAHLTG